MTKTGAFILTVFAAIWWLLGLPSAGQRSWVVYAVPTVAALAILALAFGRKAGRPAPDRDEKRADRIVMIASAAEGVAILLAVNILNNTGLGAYIIPAIAVIVGLHFLPLAHLLPAPRYYFTAVLLLAIGISGVFFSDVAARVLAVTAGAAVVLWATAISIIL